jgi:hypothetical protein
LTLIGDGIFVPLSWQHLTVFSDESFCCWYLH